MVDGHLLPSAQMAQQLHDIQLLRFGGAPGLRDPGLLDSAMNRAAQALVYGKNVGLVDCICAMAEGIVHNHAFVDGNKRTAFAVLDLTLTLNGLRLELDPEAAARMMVDLASGLLSPERFRDLIRDRTVQHTTA